MLSKFTQFECNLLVQIITFEWIFFQVQILETHFLWIFEFPNFFWMIEFLWFSMNSSKFSTDICVQQIEWMLLQTSLCSKIHLKFDMLFHFDPKFDYLPKLKTLCILKAVFDCLDPKFPLIFCLQSLILLKLWSSLANFPFWGP